MQLLRTLGARTLGHHPEKWSRLPEKIMLKQEDFDSIPSNRIKVWGTHSRIWTRP
jgi:hypothetical protein